MMNISEQAHSSPLNDDELTRIFNEIDDDGNGYITPREAKKAFKKFLETNAASLKNNSMCTPVSNNMSNVSNNCHIVYMDGSPSYPATGASVINLSQGAQAR